MLSRRIGWWAASLALVLVLGHAWVIDRQARLVSDLAREEVRIALPYQLVRPEFTVDGHMWIRHAVALLEDGGLRLRETGIDNAPHGREVHWNSGYAWWLAGGGWIWQKITGLPLSHAVERWAMWANAPLLLGLVLLFGSWTWRRSGWKAGLLVAGGMVIHQTLYEGFWPGYADHHGLALAALLGMLLSAWGMRGGWLRRNDARAETRARAAARWSGFWGGVALWVSAASAVPVIVLTALSALGASGLLRRRLAARADFCAAVWQEWGRTGALTSLGFYLLEYFPFHLGWRLEVNHPLHALAWWTGAVLVARAMPLVADAADREARRRLLGTACWALPLAAAPAIVVAVARDRVFLPLDPFLVGLHETIIEFMPLLARLETDGWWPHLTALVLMPLLHVLAAALLRVRGADRWSLLFALGVSVPLHLLGFLQSRWALSAGPGQILLVACVVLALPKVPWVGERARRIAWVAGSGLLLLLGPPLGLRIRDALTLARVQGITAGDARQLVYREVAQVIRASQPSGEVVLFGSPNTSVNVGFFGDFRTLGTLYWENLEGLRAAAEISAAPTDDEAARLIRARGVTHLAFFRDGNYILEYAKLLRPGATLDEARRTFGFRLLGGRQVPVWLEALPYAAPDGLPEGVDREVLVFKVNFGQKPADAAYRLGQLQQRRLEVDDALRTYALAIELDPRHYPAALRRGEIFVAREDWEAAEACFDQAVAMAPTEERYRLLTQVGIGFGGRGQPGRAVDYYERALREVVTNTVAPNNLAWILATARDPALRAPARALELARRCAELEPDNPPILGTLAAAEAAAGDFAAAASTLARAMDLARRQNALALLPQMEERLAAYRRQQVWFAP